jgi:hypothetical protein
MGWFDLTLVLPLKNYFKKALCAKGILDDDDTL